MAGTKIRKHQLGPLNIDNSDIAAAAAIAVSKIASAGDKSWTGKHTFSDVLTIAGGASNYLSFQFGNRIGSANDGRLISRTNQSHDLEVGPSLVARVNNSGLQVTGTVTASGAGSIKAGSGVTITGTLSNRLLGSGDVEINADSVGTNLGITGTTGARTITSSTGTSAVIPAATTSVSGVMTPSQVSSLNAKADQSYVSAAIQTLSEDIEDLDNNKEPAFSKNTAFNKNFGTTAGTVAQGNHTHAASAITSGTLASARLPIASAGALGAIRIGAGLTINGSGVVSTQLPEGGLSYIGEISWTEFADPNGPAHPMAEGYYRLIVSDLEQNGLGTSPYVGPKSGEYLMTVQSNHSVIGSQTGVGTVRLKHMFYGWEYNVYHDFGGNIQIYPLNSAETIQMYAGNKMTAGGTEETLWEVDLSSTVRYPAVEMLTHKGDRIEIECAGSFLSSSGSKQMRVRVGTDAAPVQAFSHIFSAIATMWSMRVVVTRKDHLNCDVETFLRHGTTLADSYQFYNSASYAKLEVIRITAESSNPIMINTGRATYYPNFAPIDS